jgi:5'-AMP-activated protein kinase regulatory beta subunit
VNGISDRLNQRTGLTGAGITRYYCILLGPGVFPNKFIGGGSWRYDPGQPAMYDLNGYVNIVVEVQGVLLILLRSSNGQLHACNGHMPKVR